MPAALFAQTGCPGCVVSLPANLPEDTIFLQSIPPGERGVAYDEDISFRMPKTTTPVANYDSVTPPNLPISKIEIVGVENMPPGLQWQFSQTIFQTADQTDGCIKICGKPTEADTFILMIKLKATVLFLSQESTFPMRFVVHPKASSTAGFSMDNVEGCGTVEVAFVNNIPSGGLDGFVYEWDFGDSTSFVGENPPPHTYDEPGVYPVRYHATIDTAGFVLESITVLSVGCVDQLGVGSPDLYAIIKDADNAEVFNSQPDIPNTVLPHTFAVNLPLEEGFNYTLGVYDEDSGLKGSDDDCGIVSFNILSNDTIVSGSFKVILNIKHLIEEIESFDTVVVYPLPPVPSVMAPNGLEDCAGSDSLVLGSSFGAGNQWFLDGQAIAGANDFVHTPLESGVYQVAITNGFGCSSISAGVEVLLHPLPQIPTYINGNNRLRLLDVASLPAAYALQWFMFDAPIPGETGLTYCVTESGVYGLQVTDVATGCTNYFESSIVFDPNFDCTVGTGEALPGRLAIFPNPTQGEASLQLDFGGQLLVRDMAGRLLKTLDIAPGARLFNLDCSSWPAGVYLLELQGGGERRVGRLVVE